MRRYALCLIATLLVAPIAAHADETTPPAKAAAPEFPHWPRVGGHFGLALSIAFFDNDGSHVIGRDYVQIGVTPGITLKLDVDPGVVYNFGRVAGGLRLAAQIGEGVPLNFGIVPIVVVPFAINKKLSYFLELDLPVFVHAYAGVPATALTPAVDSRVVGSLTILLQTGFAF